MSESSNCRVPQPLRPRASAIFWSLALVVSLGGAAAAAPQQPAKDDLPVSTARIREKLTKEPPNPKLQASWQQPVARFTARVDERIMVLTFDEWLAKEFKLNDLQRQSADWASRCCGFNLNAVVNEAGKALQRRKVRKIRAQIASELREIESARTRETQKQ